MLYILAFLNFIHLVAIFALVGGIIIIRVISTPVMRKLESSDPMAGVLLVEVTNRLIKFFWIYLGLSLITGIPMTFLNPHYKGLGGINTWSGTIIIKHILFVALIIAVTIQTFTVRKLWAIIQGDEKNEEKKKLTRKMDAMALVYLIIGVLLLFITSVAVTGKINAMTFLNFIHVLFTVFWIGGMMFLGFMAMPVVGRNISKMGLVNAAGHVLAVARKFVVVFWTAYLLAIATGIPMALASPKYQGFLKLDNAWSKAMLAKHFVFVFMFFGSFASTLIILKLNKFWKASQSNASDENLSEIDQLRRQMGMMARMGSGLGALVLLLTAIATTVGR